LWALLLAIPLACLGVFNTYKAVKRINHVEASPIYKSLDHLGRPPYVAGLIEQEVNTENNLSAIRSIQLTSSWLLHKSFFGLTVFHLNEVVWIYLKVTKHYYNFIPTGKSHAIMIRDCWGRRVEMDTGRGSSSENAVAGLMSTLMNRLPWVVAGYSDDLKRIFDKDRAGFVAAVWERREQFLHPAAIKSEA
jgi:hypothetical protein